MLPHSLCNFYYLSIYYLLSILSNQECQVEDSGTESDDETEKDDVEDAEAEEEEDGDISEWRAEEIFLVKQLNIFLLCRLGQRRVSEPAVLWAGVWAGRAHQAAAEPQQGGASHRGWAGPATSAQPPPSTIQQPSPALQIKGATIFRGICYSENALV